MFEKCVPCSRIGESCVPNLMLLPFPSLIDWCLKRQKYLGWTNQVLAEKSTVPLSTISRIKAGDYLDCKYSTIRNLLIALIGGTTDEWPCNAQVDKELQQMELLEQQAAKISVIEEENAFLKDRISHIEDFHRQDILAIRAEYCTQIDFLKEDLQAWRKVCCQSKE